MTNSPNAMPGAYNFNTAQRDTGSLPRVSGAKSHIYQPPRTPTPSASSSLILTRSTTSLISTTTSIARQGQKSGPRKRTLNDYNDVETPEMSRLGNEWDTRHAEDWTPSSPKPFVNTRYQLAGGMDTPSLGASTHDDDQGYAPAGYRRSLSDMDEKTEIKGRSVFQSNEPESYFALDREANGRGRGQVSQNNGWGKGAISVVGAVVGKAWEFCKAGATVFTGFRAGGGQAYGYNDISSMSHFEAVENEANWESEKQEYEARTSAPLPGGFPEEDFIPEFYSNPATPEDSPARPSKRRQVSGGFRDEEMAKNWVVVQKPPTPTPSQIQNRLLPKPSLVPRRSMLPTSRPSSRASVGSGARRPLNGRPSHAGSPGLNPTRGASFVSPRAQSKIPRASPLRETKYQVEQSPEVKRWKAQTVKREREEDETIRRLDEQLKAMIREGKEALGTKVEVVDEDMEDDYKPRWAF